MLVITGAPYSGTTTCAKIFGLTHEVLFHPRRKDVDDLVGKHVAESSCLARPFVHELESMGIAIIHLIRHPILFVRSALARHIWGFKKPEAPYTLFIEKHLGHEIGSSPASLLELWYEWNKPLRRYPCIRIEDVRSAPRLNQTADHKRITGRIDIGDVPDEIRRFADHYGYEVNDYVDAC